MSTLLSRQGHHANLSRLSAWMPRLSPQRQPPEGPPACTNRGGRAPGCKGPWLASQECHPCLYSTCPSPAVHSHRHASSSRAGGLPSSALHSPQPAGDGCVQPHPDLPLLSASTSPGGPPPGDSWLHAPLLPLPPRPPGPDSCPSPPAAVLASLHPPDLGRRHPGCLSDLRSLPFRPIFPVTRVLFLKCRPGHGSPWNNAACHTQTALLGQPVKLWMTRPPACPLPILAPPAGQ